MTHQTTIEFQHITFTRQDETILHNISGTFHEGTITALIGPSGSGKTTLLKMLNGLLSPSSGTITILNKNIEAYNPIELRTTVGIALQDAPVIRGTVFENLSLPYSLRGKTFTKQEAIQFLHYVGLDDSLIDRDASDLSGGQRQRLSLARTLVNEPKVLLLDEITSALDPTATSEIEQLIKKITYEKHVTTVWITHNIRQALSISDNIMLINSGEITFSAPTNQLTDEHHEILAPFLNGGAQR